MKAPDIADAKLDRLKAIFFGQGKRLGYAKRSLKAAGKRPVVD